MNVHPKNLLATFQEDGTLLLKFWNRWQEEFPWRLLEVTALGDIIYEYEESEGGIYYTNTRLPQGMVPVAEDEAEYTKIKSTKEFCQRFLNPQLVADLIDEHGALKFGQCFSPLKPPLSGGKVDDPSNYQKADIYEHLAIFGILHELRERLPDDEVCDFPTLLNERGRLARLLRDLKLFK